MSLDCFKFFREYQWYRKWWLITRSRFLSFFNLNWNILPHWSRLYKDRHWYLLRAEWSVFNKTIALCSIIKPLSSALSCLSCSMECWCCKTWTCLKILQALICSFSGIFVDPWLTMIMVSLRFQGVWLPVHTPTSLTLTLTCPEHSRELSVVCPSRQKGCFPRPPGWKHHGTSEYSPGQRRCENKGQEKKHWA